MSASSSLKRGLAWGLMRSGLLSLYRAGFERRRGIVLTYHRVNDEGDPFLPALPARRFASQLEFLARHYRVVPLGDLLGWLETGADGPPRVALTIDDGYPDTLEVAFPLLRRVGLPATLFLCTGPPETGHPLWSDRVRSRIGHGASGRLELPALGLPPLTLDSTASRLLAIEQVLGRMKRLGIGEITRVLEALEEQLGPAPARLRCLGWEEVRLLAQAGLALGAHTHGHYMLRHLGDDEIVREVTTSIDLIRQRVGVQVQDFAYPNGQPEDYDERAVAILRRLGLRSAFTTRNGFARAHHDPLQLARLYTTQAFLPLFALRIGGLSREPGQEAGPGPARVALAG
jgi:peptidoglycan/xylan/chitin deacetylase (PgdA/CDA1 family)